MPSYSTHEKTERLNNFPKDAQLVVDGSRIWELQDLLSYKPRHAASQDVHPKVICTGHPQTIIMPLYCRKRVGGEADWAICGFPHQWLLSEFSPLGRNECIQEKGCSGDLPWCQKELLEIVPVDSLPGEINSFPLFKAALTYANQIYNSPPKQQLPDS